jgi:hypothetical protein
LKSANTQREFYAEVDRALEGFLADKLNLAEAGLITGEARTRLVARGVAEPTADEYLSCLEVCDRQRFAPADSTLEEMDAFLERTADAMTRLNEELSR